MPEPKTNVEIVTHLMTYSNFGALSQMFVIDALTKFSAKVAASKPEDYPNDCMVHPQSWIGVAKEINGVLASNYGARSS